MSFEEIVNKLKELASELNQESEQNTKFIRSLIKLAASPKNKTPKDAIQAVLDTPHINDDGLADKAAVIAGIIGLATPYMLHTVMQLLATEMIKNGSIKPTKPENN